VNFKGKWRPYRNQTMDMYNKISPGDRFGNRVVLERLYKNEKTHWKCRCDCGHESYVLDLNLKRGHSTKCRECQYKYWKEKSETNHPLYKIWRGMIRRCDNEKDHAYKWYGKRGISVCKEWYNLEKFSEDMGLRPSNKHTIDRIDNDANYEPSNCRWSTYKEQANNTRVSRKFTYKNMKKTVIEWATYFNTKPRRLRDYIRNHSFEEAIKFYTTK